MNEAIKILRARADSAAAKAIKMRGVENLSDAEFHSGVHAGLLTAIKVIEHTAGITTVEGHYRDGVWVEPHLRTPADADEFGHGLGEIDGGGE